jgi:hypothetical protein
MVVGVGVYTSNHNPKKKILNQLCDMTIGKVICNIVINDTNSAMNEVHLVNLVAMLIQSDFNISIKMINVTRVGDFGDQ